MVAERGAYRPMIANVPFVTPLDIGGWAESRLPGDP